MTVVRKVIDIEIREDVAIVTFNYKKVLDDQHIEEIGRQLFGLVDEVGYRKILINFSRVEHLATLAIFKLIILKKKLIKNTGKLVLCSISPEINEVFEITKLNEIFNIQKDVESGLRAFLP